MWGDNLLPGHSIIIAEIRILFYVYIAVQNRFEAAEAELFDIVHSRHVESVAFFEFLSTIDLFQIAQKS